MKKLCWWEIFLLSAMVLGMAGCAAQPLSPPPAFTPEPIQSGMWQQKADHLVFVLDASSSMLDGYNDVQKFALARNVVTNFNQTMPDLKLNAAVRSFGHDPSVSPASTLPLYGPAPYSRSGVAQSVAKLATAGGPSPLYKALQAVGADLKSAAQGKIALVIISDGEDMDTAPLAVAGGLKEQFKDRLCIYTVLVGNHPAGSALMSKLSAVTGCGAALKVDDVATGAGMAAFVKQVLLAEQADSDRDGVADASDRCPGTPQGVPVDSTGCPKDSDGDGVYDHLDRCPQTPAGVRVDQSGCPVPQAPQAAKGATVTAEGTWIFKGVQFDNNSAELKASARSVLDEAVVALKEQPGLRMEIQGHTDSRGAKAHNVSLSQRRAESVRGYLTSKGIAADRLTAKGYGPDKPIATNDTAEGRAENRRVEFKPLQ